MRTTTTAALLFLVLLTPVSACKKKDPGPQMGPGLITIKEEKLQMQLPANTSASWLSLPNPDGKGSTGVVTIKMPSGYDVPIELAGRPALVLESKARYTKQAEYAKKPLMPVTRTEEIMLDAPDAFVVRVTSEGEKWCETTACKQVGTRHLCVSTVLKETTSTTFDEKTKQVSSKTNRITEGDCTALPEIVRSFAAVP